MEEHLQTILQWLLSLLQFNMVSNWSICNNFVGVNLEDIVVFSISTGNNPKYISSDAYKTGNWGLVEWGPHLIDLLLDSNTESINYNCRCLLQDRYHRFLKMSC